MSKLRVGVIMGGRGNEREVSFNSGRTVCDHLDSFRYTIVPLFQRSNGQLYILPWRFLHRGKTTDFEHRLADEAEAVTWDSLKELIDFMYIALHGRFGEDGTIQGFLEVLGIPYLGSKVMASALGMNKVFQKQILASHGIAVPKGIVVKEFSNPGDLLKQLKSAHLTAPYIIKPSKEGSSIGISVILDKEALIIPALALAQSSDPQEVLIEEYITGMEFTCITLTDYKTGKPLCLPPTEVIPEPNTHFFDYAQKYMPGRATKFTPARCSESVVHSIQETCMKVAQVLNFTNVSRIDGFVKKNGDIVITDPNSLCGMAPSSFIFRQAAEVNMSHTAIINHLIETELAQYGMLKALETKEERMHMDKLPKKRIAVLMGGPTHERETSLDTGRNVCYKLSPQKYEAVPLFVDNQLNLYKINQELLVRNSTHEIVNGLEPHMKVAWNDLPHLADFVFIGLHGGEGENGCIQGTLEMLNMPYNGSSILASSLCMDKYLTANYLKSQGFDVPRNCLIDKSSWEQDPDAVIASLLTIAPLPLIVKPHDDGCSVLVFKAKTHDELIDAITMVFNDGKKVALVEEFIQGQELTVGVIGNNKAQALPPSLTVTTNDILTIEEKFLPGAGENLTPAPLPSSTLAFIQKTMADAYAALDCKGYARIDCFYQDATISPTKADRVVILECNTLPALTPATCIFHQAAEIGLKPMEFIDLIIELGYENYKQTVATAQIAPTKKSEQKSIS